MLQNLFGSTRFWLVVAAVVLALAATAGYAFWLGWNDSPDYSALNPPPVLLPTEVAVAPVYSPALTHDASELQRIMAEHSRLLTSLPPTLGPTFTPTPEEAQLDAAALVSNNPAGIPYPTRELQNWFDPELGLDFYRPEGGDWTGRGLRNSHPYRELFYFEEYPSGIPNFDDRSIYNSIARELAMGAADVLPVLGDPSTEVVQTFSRRLGWAIRDPSLPVVNVWTTFEFLDGQVTSVYAVGGVLRMRLGTRTAGVGSPALEYLTPGDFVGPVVVQRIKTRTR